MNLPNKLTVARMVMVVIIVIISVLNITGNIGPFDAKYFIIDIIFIIASLTDKLDGYLARKNNQITDFGKFLDPIADKLLVISSMIILVGDGHLPAWIPIITIMREFLVSGYRLVEVGKNGKVIAASWWGKIKTVTQMVAIILAFLDRNSFGDCFYKGLTGAGFVLNLVVTILMIMSVIATIFSGYEYLKNGKDLLKDA